MLFLILLLLVRINVETFRVISSPKSNSEPCSVLLLLSLNSGSHITKLRSNPLCHYRRLQSMLQFQCGFSIPLRIVNEVLLLAKFRNNLSYLNSAACSSYLRNWILFYYVRIWCYLNLSVSWIIPSIKSVCSSNCLCMNVRWVFIQSAVSWQLWRD
jgi:hypothetical protein